MIRHAFRRVRCAADRVMGRNWPVILLYHQIADISCDPWNLAVAPDRFAAQIEALTRVRRVVPLDELRDIRGGGKPLAAITFDDGYRNVAQLVAPILERFDCTATVFLTTGAIGAARELWWDELSRIVLESAYTGLLEFSLGGDTFRYVLDDKRRRRVLRQIWTVLRLLDPVRRADILERLAARTGTALSPRSTHAIMTADDVVKLQGGPLTVGAHTVTHPFLPGLDAAAQKREIEQSRQDCLALTGVAPAAFSYPFGNYCPTAAKAVEAAGFSIAVTCNRDVVRPDAVDLLLPRAPTFDCDGEALLRTLP